MYTLSRREFLKTSVAFSTSLVMSNAVSPFVNAVRQEGAKPNILVLVFDAMSAEHFRVQAEHFRVPAEHFPVPAEHF